MKSEGITMDVNFSIFLAASSYLLKVFSGAGWACVVIGGGWWGGGGAGGGGLSCCGGGGSGGLLDSFGDLRRISPTPLLWEMGARGGLWIIF